MCRTLLALLLLAGCSADPTELTLELSTGHEQDAFDRAPAITRLEVAARDVSGDAVAAATTAPGGTFSLGELGADELLTLEVGGYYADGGEGMRGRSLALLPGAVQSDVLPLFVARLDEWARPPGELPTTHVTGLAATVGERYLMLAGGLSADGEPSAAVTFYDMLALGGSSGGQLSRVPQSLAVSSDGNAVLFIDAESATWVDFAQGHSEAAPPPAPLSDFAAVAGGRTVRGPSASYLVGATRHGDPSDWVLVVAPDRSLTTARLTAPRQGAAATWVTDRGLVVVGGSDTAAGLELLAEGADAAVAHPYPPDAAQGAAATAGLSADEVLLFCGQAAGQPVVTRSVDLGCAANCLPKTIAIEPPLDLEGCNAYATTQGAVLVVGHVPTTGETRALSVELTGPSASELVLREPRRGAMPLPAPNGTLALLGGVHFDGSAAVTVETLFPR